MVKKTFDCPFCKRPFEKQAQLDIHLSNGWCKEMKKHKLENRKVYKVLTGKDMTDPAFFEEKVVAVAPQVPVANEVKSKTSKAPKVFSVHDRRILDMFKNKMGTKLDHLDHVDNEDLPLSGNVYHGWKSKGLSATLKKEMRENGSVIDQKLDTLSSSSSFNLIRMGDNFCVLSKHSNNHLTQSPNAALPLNDCQKNRRFSSSGTLKISLPVAAAKPLSQNDALENKENTQASNELSSLKISIPMIKKESKSERIARATREIPANFENLRKLLAFLADSCTFCQQAQALNVEAVFLLSHLLILHDRQMIHQYLNEDAQDSLSRIKTYMRDAKVKEVIFKPEKMSHYQCCNCHKTNDELQDLFGHLDQDHSTKMLSCHLCNNFFLNYGSFKSHVCFGPGGLAKFSCLVCSPSNKYEELCSLPSFLDFQKHLRSYHIACDVCLQVQDNEESLREHCLGAHNQELMCMKCLMSYDSPLQFRKHLFLKHESEADECAKCHDKTWPFAFHFCVSNDQTSYSCEVCELSCENIRKYRVHIRTHTGQAPHACEVKACRKSYVSKHLLLKHYIRRHPDLRPMASTQLEQRRTQKYLQKMGASDLDHVFLCQNILEDLINKVIEDEQPEPEKDVKINEETEDAKKEEVEQPLEEEEEEEVFDPIASAVASIMGPDGAFDIRKSPVKPVAQAKPLPSSAIKMPPLMPIDKKETPAKPQPKPVEQPKIDPLKEMLKKEQMAKDFPEAPSNILPPSSIKEIVNGIEKPAEKAATDDKAQSDSAEEDDEAKINPVLGGIWNQDLMFVSNDTDNCEDLTAAPSQPENSKSDKVKKGCKVMKPRYQVEDAKRKSHGGLKTINNAGGPRPSGEWEVLLSESSGSDNEDQQGQLPRKARIQEKVLCDKRTALREHDYCFAAFMMAKQVEKPKEDLSEMDKILSNVALGALDQSLTEVKAEKRHKKSKKEGKKKKKKRKKHKRNSGDGSTSDSDLEVDVINNQVTKPEKVQIDFFLHVVNIKLIISIYLEKGQEEMGAKAQISRAGRLARCHSRRGPASLFVLGGRRRRRNQQWRAQLV